MNNNNNNTKASLLERADGTTVASRTERERERWRNQRNINKTKKENAQNSEEKWVKRVQWVWGVGVFVHREHRVLSVGRGGCYKE
jgi:hypothetical protein